MAPTQDTDPDAIAEPELAEIDGKPASNTNPKKRNAFTDLMDASKRPKPTSPDKPTRKSAPHGLNAMSNLGKNGLAAYITDPSAFSPREIIYSTPSFVAIRDAYPKASVHALLIPRNSDKSLLHPFDAFSDASFLAEVRAELPKLIRIVASELRHKFSKFSAQEAPRIQAMQAEEPPDVLPEGRDWEAEVITGVHAGPSMNHLHVHVISVDHVSEWMKHRKHYQSFKTGFLVRLDELPLKEDDPRRRPDRGGGLREDMRCWRCGKNFGAKFAELKRHLAEEFEEWKRV